MNIDLLKNLCTTYGVSGREQAICGLISDYMKNIADTVEIDGLGNIICTKFGKSDKSVILDAHIDSVGFVINKIYENGFASFSSVGGIDDRILPAQEVVIHGKKDINGIITSKPPHLTKTDEKEINSDKLFIDTGINENIDEIITVGDLVSFKSSFDVLNKYVCATSLDNRAGVAAIIEVYSQFKDLELPYNLIAVFSTREEIGLKGAYYQKQKSNLAIVIDVTHGKTPDENRDLAFRCSKGVAFGYGPNIDKYYFNLLKSSADKHNISYQLEILEGSSGTNAWAYQTLNGGIPCLLLSFPLKYMHTPVECISIFDYDNMIEHLTTFLKNIDLKYLKSTNLELIGDRIG